MVTRMIRLAAPLLGMLAAACVDLPDPPIVSRAVDPTSPAAQQVLRAEAEARTRDYPTFADVQAYPTDVRSPAAFNSAAQEVITTREALQRWQQANPPELTNTEAFAAGQRAQIDVSDLPPAPTPEESAAFAAAQRRAASGN